MHDTAGKGSNACPVKRECFVLETAKEDWSANGHKMTFRFSEPRYRDDMIAQVTRLLRRELYSVVSQRDDDPAKPVGHD